MGYRFLRIGLLVLTIITVTGCESIPTPTGASTPTEEEVWGSGEDGQKEADKEAEGEAGQEDANNSE